MAHTVQGHAASATQQTAITAMVTAHGTLTNVSLKVQKKHLHTYFDRSQSSFYFIPQGSTVRDPPLSLVKDQAFYVFFSSRNPSLKYVLSGQCGPFTSKDQLGPFFVVSVLLVLFFFQPKSNAHITIISF